MRIFKFIRNKAWLMFFYRNLCKFKIPLIKIVFLNILNLSLQLKCLSFSDHRSRHFIQDQHSSSRCGIDIHVTRHDPEKCAEQVRHGHRLEHSGSAFGTG